MKIAVGSDHAGFEYKSKIIDWLNENDYNVIDFGCFSKESVDYPDYAFLAAEAISNQDADFGIIICGSGIGVSITANKVKGVRAANCCNADMAKLARQHNDANILAFGERLIDIDTAIKMSDIFLNTKFEGGRHKKRVEKIHFITGV